MASMIGLNNNSDSDSENIGTQDKEATITKKKRGEGKTYFFSETFASIELAKKQLKRKEHGHGRLKKLKKTLLNNTIGVIRLNNVVPDNVQLD